MTEFEKCQAGLMYDTTFPGREEDHLRCADLCYEYTFRGFCDASGTLYGESFQPSDNLRLYASFDKTPILYEITFDVDGDIDHSAAPALEDCLVVEKDGKKYYMYECEKCHIFIVVAVEDVVAP